MNKSYHGKKLRKAFLKILLFPHISQGSTNNHQTSADCQQRVLIKLVGIITIGNIQLTQE